MNALRPGEHGEGRRGDRHERDRGTLAVVLVVFVTVVLGGAAISGGRILRVMPIWVGFDLLSPWMVRMKAGTEMSE